MDINDIDFSAIANTGISAQEACDALFHFFNHPDHQKFFDAFDAGYRARYGELQDGTPIIDAPAVVYPDGTMLTEHGVVYHE
jgi:hypothetical protein